MDDDVVHLHLEHRVVQRLLGRFTAQGFVHHDLSRACLAQTTDAIPRVVLLGRLCLYGPGAARLHEELIPVTARWTDPQDPQGVRSGPTPAKPRPRRSSLLEEALLAGTGRADHRPRCSSSCRHAAPRDIRSCCRTCKPAARNTPRMPGRSSSTAAQAEAKAMREILETQKKHIADTVAKHDKDRVS